LSIAIPLISDCIDFDLYAISKIMDADTVFMFSFLLLWVKEGESE